MKKILDSNIFYFLLGAIIFSTMTAYAVTLMDSEEITFTTKDSNWKVNTVQEALDDLYKKELHEEYTETTTITPNESIQTLPTKNKVLKNDIIINPVPEIYKNLTANTTVTESSLLKGMTAYDKNGNLITGRISSTECVSGIFVCDSNCIGSTGQIVVSEFAPSEFMIIYNNESIFYYNEEWDSLYTYNYTFSTANWDKSLIKNNYNIDNNTLTIFSYSKNALNRTYNYIACK